MTKEENNYQIGLVKWFGGYNSRTERENDYGFIQSMTSEDLFVHKNEVASETSLKENDIVIFKLKVEGDRKFAVNAFLGGSDLSLLINIYKSYYSKSLEREVNKSNQPSRSES